MTPIPGREFTSTSATVEFVQRWPKLRVNALRYSQLMTNALLVTTKIQKLADENSSPIAFFPVREKKSLAQLYGRKQLRAEGRGLQENVLREADWLAFGNCDIQVHPIVALDR